MQPSFKVYAKQIVANAKTLAETLMAGGVKLASGGTDNHLMLADVTTIGLTGKIAEQTLDRAGITANKNMIPYDQRKPLDPSGIRLGTAALTTRGMKEAEMETIADLIARGLQATGNDAALAGVAAEVRALCERFPLYRQRLA